MTTPHPDIGPELRRLAQVILDRLDPAVRAAAAMATETLSGPGRCRQVWCPVCALAAVVSGEQHPLLTVIADHSVALMAVIRTMATAPGDPTQPAPPGDHEAAGPAAADGHSGPAAADGHSGPAAAPGGYLDIPVIVEPFLERDIVGEGIVEQDIAEE